MVMNSRALDGKRVLIVEDEMLVALLLEDFLIEFGCTPLGPCGSVAEALAAVREESFDLAVLDVNLGGERVYPVADALDAKQIPFFSCLATATKRSRPGGAAGKCVPNLSAPKI